MIKLFSIIALLCLCLFPSGMFACGPEWTYMGSGTSSTRIHELADSAGILLRVGNGPGIYRWTGQDTTWELTSQLDRPLFKLMEYPEIPHQLIGMDRIGRIFRSFDNGFSWDTLRPDPLCSICHNYFTIDPSNPTNWYMAGHEPAGCFVERSTDSGVNWEPLWICCGACPMLFEEVPGYLYLTSYSGGSLYRCSLADSTLEFVLNIGNYRNLSTLKHPSQPWFYLYGFDWNSPQVKIVRYNLETGDTTAILVPDSSETIEDDSYMQFAEGLGLFVTTGHDIIQLSEDLRDVTILTGNLPAGLVTNMLLASPEMLIVCIEGQGLFCRTPAQSVSPTHPVNTISLLEAYPNPFNSTSTIRLELSKASVVKLDVFDLLGRKVKSAMPCAATSVLGAGEHRITFDGSELSSGIYFLRMETGEQIQIRKMMLIK